MATTIVIIIDDIKALAGTGNCESLGQSRLSLALVSLLIAAISLDPLEGQLHAGQPVFCQAIPPHFPVKLEPAYFPAASKKM